MELTDVAILQALKEGTDIGIFEKIESYEEKYRDSIFETGEYINAAIDRAISALQGGSQGQWKEAYMVSKQSVSQTCSCCSNTVIRNIANVFHFCPACGAKMDL